MRIRLLVAILCLLCLTSRVYAGWSVPQEVINGSWGSGVGHFYFASGDSFDSFPKNIGVDKNGAILISDEDNNRIYIYNNDGTIKKVLAPPPGLPAEDSVYGWPSSTGFVLYSGGNSFALDCEYKTISGGIQPLKICFLDYNGNILNKADMSEVFAIETGFVLLKNNIYSLYSPTGQFLKTSAEKPLELGRVREQSLGSGRYKITIAYSDKEYSFIGGPFERYVRDDAKRLNAVTGKFVKKISECGKELGRLSLPKDESKIAQPGGGGFDEVRELIVEYGTPVVAPNGDVYTWKRTPDKYSILKWTWVDDPNVPTGPDAPSGLAVIPSIDGLYLTWTASPNDPGCVTKYEIARATTSGGVFSAVGTVEKGILKYNDTSAEVGAQYYYKVRAMAGSDPSLYTGEASGKR